MGGKTGTTNQTSTVSIPPEVLARYNAVNARAEGLADTPFTPYTGQFVAPLTGTQQSGISNIDQSQYIAGPYYDAASQAMNYGYQGAGPYFGAATNSMIAGQTNADQMQSAASQNIGSAYNNAQGYQQAATEGVYGAQASAQPYAQAANQNLAYGQNAGQYWQGNAGQDYANALAYAQPYQQAYTQAVGNAYNGAQGYQQAATQGVSDAYSGAQPYQQASTNAAYGAYQAAQPYQQDAYNSVAGAYAGAQPYQQGATDAAYSAYKGAQPYQQMATQGAQSALTNARPYQQYANQGYQQAMGAAQPFQQMASTGLANALGYAEPYQGTSRETLMGAYSGAQPYQQESLSNVYNALNAGAPYQSESRQGINSAYAQAQPFQQQSANNINAALAAVQPYISSAQQGFSGAIGAAQPLNDSAAQNVYNSFSRAQPYQSNANQSLNNAFNTAQGYQQGATAGVQGALSSAVPYNQSSEEQLRTALSGAQGYENVAKALGLSGADAVSPTDLNGAAIDKYMSPYQQNVVDATMKNLREQQQQEQSQLLGNQIMSGAFGGDRGRIAQANLARQQDIASGTTLAGLLNQGYGQALSTAQQQQGQQLAADQANRAARAQTGAAMAALGQQGFGQGLSAAQQLAALGQQNYSQGLGAAQQMAALGQQGFGQGATMAQQQAALGQQEFGQGMAASQQLGNLGNQAFNQQSTSAQNLANLGNMGFGQGMNAAQQYAALGNQGFNQGAQRAQQLAALGQQGFGQNLSAAQQIGALGQQGYAQGANTAQQLAALGQQGFGNQLSVAQQNAALGQQAYQQGTNTADRMAALGQQGFGQEMALAQQLGALGQQGFGQGNALAQQLANIGQQGYAQGLGAAQQYGNLGQQNYQQGANLAQQLSAFGNQGFNQGLAAAQQMGALGNQGFNQGVTAGQQYGNIGQQGFAQNLAAGQQRAALGQQAYGQGLSSAQQNAAMGQQAYTQNLGAASQLANIGQQGFGQGMTAAQQQAALGNQMFNQGAQGAQAYQGLGQALYNLSQGYGQGMAGLGTTAQDQALKGAQAQIAAGSLDQQTNQAYNQALYNQFLQQQGYPFQVAQFLANIAMGTGALSGSTTNATTTAPTSFFSDERLKRDIEPIGKTFDGQDIVRFKYKGQPGTRIGLIAQDVEKHHPEAVGLAGGYRTVDYDKATDDAADRGHFASGGASDVNAMLEEILNSGKGAYPYGKIGLYGQTSKSGGPYGTSQMQVPSRGLMRAELGRAAPQESGAQQMNNAMQAGQNIGRLYEGAEKVYDYGKGASEGTNWLGRTLGNDRPNVSNEAVQWSTQNETSSPFGGTSSAPASPAPEPSAPASSAPAPSAPSAPAPSAPSAPSSSASLAPKVEEAPVRLADAQVVPEKAVEATGETTSSLGGAGSSLAGSGDTLLTAADTGEGIATTGETATQVADLLATVGEFAVARGGRIRGHYDSGGVTYPVSGIDVPEHINMRGNTFGGQQDTSGNLQSGNFVGAQSPQQSEAGQAFSSANRIRGAYEMADKVLNKPPVQPAPEASSSAGGAGEGTGLGGASGAQLEAAPLAAEKATEAGASTIGGVGGAGAEGATLGTAGAAGAEGAGIGAAGTAGAGAAGAEVAGLGAAGATAAGTGAAAGATAAGTGAAAGAGEAAAAAIAEILPYLAVLLLKRGGAVKPYRAGGGSVFGDAPYQGNSYIPDEEFDVDKNNKLTKAKVTPRKYYESGIGATLDPMGKQMGMQSMNDPFQLFRSSGGLVPRHGYATDGTVSDDPEAQKRIEELLGRIQSGEVQNPPDHFRRSVERTLGFEGGLNPSDSNGSPSNFGINQRANPDVDVRNLTRDQATDLYRRRYWDAVGGDDLAARNPDLAHVVFDTAVIAGPERAKSLLAEAGDDPSRYLELRRNFQTRLLEGDPNKYGPYRDAWANRIAGLASDVGSNIPTGLGVATSGSQQPARGLAASAERTAANSNTPPGMVQTLPDWNSGEPFTALQRRVGEITDRPKREDDNWLRRNQDWVLPILTGLGTMASSNSRYLGSALLQGVAGGANQYYNMQQRGEEQDLRRQNNDISRANAIMTAGREDIGRSAETRAQLQLQALIASRAYDTNTGLIRVYDRDGRFRLISLSEFNQARRSGRPYELAPVMPAQSGSQTEGAVQRPQVTTENLPAPPRQTEAAPTQTTAAPQAQPVPAAQPEQRDAAPAQQPSEQAEAGPIYRQLPDDMRGFLRQRAIAVEDTPGTVATPVPANQNPFAIASTEAAQSQATLPERNSLTTSLVNLARPGAVTAGQFGAQVTGPLLGYVNSVLAAAGMPDRISAEQLATQEAANKISRAMAITMQQSTGTRALGELTVTLQTIPTAANSPQGAAKVLADLYVAQQRPIDAANFFNLSRRELESNGLNENQIPRAGGELMSEFNRRQNAVYGREHANLEDLFGQMLTVRDPRTGQSTDVPLAEHIIKNAGNLDPKLVQSLEQRYGPNILRYFTGR